LNGTTSRPSKRYGLPLMTHPASLVASALRRLALLLALLLGRGRRAVLARPSAGRRQPRFAGAAARASRARIGARAILEAPIAAPWRRRRRVRRQRRRPHAHPMSASGRAATHEALVRALRPAARLRSARAPSHAR